MIACTLPALTDYIPERKRRELAGEVTSELQVVGKAASIAIQTWVRNNTTNKTKARAEKREKNIGWIKRLFTAWRVSHAERNERRAEREEAGEEDSEEDETPVVIPSSDVMMYPKGTPAPTSSVEVQVFEERNGVCGASRHVQKVQKVSRRCPEGVQKMSRRCPEGWKRIWERLESPLQVC